MKSTRLTADCTPHWPGMLRWLEQVAMELEGERPDAVAITGGDGTALFAAFDDRVMRFDLGTLVPTSTTSRDLRNDRVLLPQQHGHLRRRPAGRGR